MHHESNHVSAGESGLNQTTTLDPATSLETSDFQKNQNNAVATKKFAELGADETMVTALANMGFAHAFPVQIESFEPITRGEDLIVQAKTGSGKTAAFGVPLIQNRIQANEPVQDGQVQALVLVPTRELALQVSKQLEKIAEGRSIQVVTLYGGAPIQKQTEQLKEGAHIVVGTPGRLLDHVRRKTVHLGKLRTLVLDEADEMFSRGFLEDIQAILQECPADRQTLLFSATLPDQIRHITHSAMRSPVHIQPAGEPTTPSEISHFYYMVSGMGRTKDLLRIIDVEKPNCAIIFCNTKNETEEVASYLRTNGLNAQAISSNLTQAAREKVMDLMQQNRLRFLVATDIAARGIDINHLTHVFHYTFPESAEVYIHRTGRTGRAGQKGTAISLIGPRELGSFYTFKLSYKIRPEEKVLPPAEDLQRLREEQCIHRLQQEIVRVPQPLFMDIARRMPSLPDGERWVAVLLEHYLTTQQQDLDSEGAENAQGTTDTASRLPASGNRENARHPRNGRTREAPGKRVSLGSDSLSSRRERPSVDSEKGKTEEARKRREPRPARDGHPADQASRAPRKPAMPSRQTAAPVAISTELIDTNDGRDYWEAWVDSKKADTLSQPAPQASSVTPENQETAAVNENAALNAGLKNPRSSRRRRPTRRPAQPANKDGLTKLYLNMGGRHGFEQEQLEALFAQNQLPVPFAQIHGTHSYLFVPQESADAIIQSLHRKPFGNRSLVCEKAREHAPKVAPVGTADPSAEPSATAPDSLPTLTENIQESAPTVALPEQTP